MKLRAAREKKMEQISANEIMEKTQLKKNETQTQNFCSRCKRTALFTGNH